jgi:hypothetical protein
VGLVLPADKRTLEMGLSFPHDHVQESHRHGIRPLIDTHQDDQALMR